MLSGSNSQPGAAAVNLVAGEKPADVYSRIAARYEIWLHSVRGLSGT